MNSMKYSSSCPYCRKSFKSAGPLDNHLRAVHPEHATRFFQKPGDPQRGLDNLREGSSDASTQLLQDFQRSFDHPVTTSETLRDSDMESEAGDEYLPPADESRVEEYRGCAKTYGSIFGEEDGVYSLLRDPWTPFRNASEFKLARFFLQSGTSMGAIDSFLKADLAPAEVGYRSAHTFRRLLDTMETALGPESWHCGDVTMTGQIVPFYYRMPLDCIAYLLRQKAYKKDMVYAPQRLWEGGERQYGELQTADWWWDTQVCHAKALVKTGGRILIGVRKHFQRGQL
jgi:hypothetical protein